MSRALLIATVLAVVSTASADTPKQQARALVGDADAAYKGEHYDVALVDYTKAYDLFPVPALLFNIGQCHRQLQHYALAAEAYQGFLNRATPSDDDRAMVQDLLAQVQRADADEKARVESEAKARGAARKAAEEKAAKDRADAAARDAYEPLASTPAATASHPIYTRWWFWAAVGGVAAVAAGGSYYATHSGSSIPEGSLGALDRR